MNFVWLIVLVICCFREGELQPVVLSPASAPAPTPVVSPAPAPAPTPVVSPAFAPATKPRVYLASAPTPTPVVSRASPPVPKPAVSPASAPAPTSVVSPASAPAPTSVVSPASALAPKPAVSQTPAPAPTSVVSPAAAPTPTPAVSLAPTLKPPVSPASVPAPKPVVSQTSAPAPKPAVSPAYALTPKPVGSPASSPAPTPVVSLAPAPEFTTAVSVPPASASTSVVSPAPAPANKPVASLPSAGAPKKTVSPAAAPIRKPTVSPASALEPKPVVSPASALAPKPTVSPASALEPKPAVSPASALEPKPVVSPELALAPKSAVSPASALTTKPAVAPELALAPKPAVSPASALESKPVVSLASAPTPKAVVSSGSAPAPNPAVSPASAPALKPVESQASAPAPKPTVSPASAPAPKPEESPASGPEPKPAVSPASAPALKPVESPASAPAPKPTVSPASAPFPTPVVSPASAPAPKPVVSRASPPTPTPVVFQASAPTLTPTPVVSLATALAPTPTLVVSPASVLAPKPVVSLASAPEFTTAVSTVTALAPTQIASPASPPTPVVSLAHAPAPTPIRSPLPASALTPVVSLAPVPAFTPEVSPKPGIAGSSSTVLSSLTYSKSPNMETYTEYRFVLMLIVRSAQFTLDYANTTSSLHNSLKTNATNQVTGMLQGSPGFVSAEFKRFRPHTLEKKPSLLLEMTITHQMNSMGKLVEKLKQEYIKPNLMFDPRYFETQHTFNSSCPAPVVKVYLNKTLDQANLIFTTDIRRSRIHALVNHSFCSQALQVNTSWEVSKAHFNLGVFGTFLKKPLNRRANSLRLFLSNSVDSYLYISYVLKDPVDQRVIAYDYGYVLLLRPPPVAKITGDTSAIKGKGSVILDALAADHSRARISRLTYSWYCRRKEEHFPVDVSRLVNVPNGNSNISGGCYGYGPGKLSGSDVYLKVDVDKMMAGQTYVFRVKVKLDTKYTTDDHNFTVIAQANLKVSCTYNCRPKATVNKRTVFALKPAVSLAPAPTPTPVVSPTSAPVPKLVVSQAYAPAPKPAVSTASAPAPTLVGSQASALAPKLVISRAPTPAPKLAVSSTPEPKPAVSPASAPAPKPAVSPASAPFPTPVVSPASAPAPKPVVSQASPPTPTPVVFQASAPTLTPTPVVSLATALAPTPTPVVSPASVLAPKPVVSPASAPEFTTAISTVPALAPTQIASPVPASALTPVVSPAHAPAPTPIRSPLPASALTPVVSPAHAPTPVLSLAPIPASTPEVSPKPGIAGSSSTVLSSSMYSKSPNMETYTEYRFVLMLIVRSAQFTLDYANTTSSLHNSLKTNATNQVTGMLQGSPGFVSAEFKRFRPHTLEKKPSLLLEMTITHQMNSMGKLVEKLKQEYIKPNLMFDPRYFETQHTFNSSCPAPVVKVYLNKTLDQANLIFTTDIRRSRIHALVNHSFCSQTLQVSTSWEVSKAHFNLGVFGTFLKKPLNRRANSLRLFLSHSVDSYLYISYVLKDRVNQRIIAYDYGYVLLLRPPPVAKITGDTSAIKGKGSVILDALAAGHSRARIPRLTYSWYCRRKEEHFPVDVSRLVNVPNGNSNISGGCYGYGPGKLSGSDVYLKVDVDKMMAGQTYVFRVKVKLDTKYTTDDHNFMVIAQANLKVSCTYNCRPKATVNKRSVFETKCSGSLCQNITRYQWFLCKTYQTIPDDPWIEIKSLQTKTLTKLDGPNFVLAGKINELEYSLEPDTIYKVKVKAFIDQQQLAEDEMTFRTNTPPVSYKNNRCTAFPSDGLVLKTSFLVNCPQWNDTDLPLSYTYSYYFHSRKEKVIIKSGSTLPYLKTILPQGHQSQDYNVTIQVEIADSLGAMSYDTLVVKVRPLADESLAVLKSIIDGPNSTLDKSLSQGDVGQAAVTANLVLSTLDNGGMKEQTKNQVKDDLLEKLGDVQVKTIQEVEHLSSFVTLATNEREDMPASSLDNTVQLLGTMTDYLWTHVDNDSDHDKDTVQRLGRSVFQGFSNAMVITTSSEATNNGSGLTKPNDVTQNTLALIDKLCTTLLFTKVVGEEPSTYISDTMSMTLDRQKPSVMGHNTLQGDEQLGGVILPSAETMFGNKTTSLDYVDAQMISLKENPYTWDESSRNISSPVIKFELKTGKGFPMSISDAKQPFEFLLPIIKQAESGKNDSKDHLFVGSVLKYHEINIDSDDKNVFVKLQPQNGAVLDVFVSSGTRPTERHYNFSTRIPDFSSCTISKDHVDYFNCTRNPFVFSFSSALTGQTGPQFIGIRLANITSSAKKENLKGHARKARSCSGSSGRQKRSCITVKDPPTTPAPTATVKPKYNESADVNYTMLVSLPSCVYWSERRQAWSTEGCKLGSNTTYEQLHCLCYHLSAFGANIFVAPNPIDFDTVFIKFTKLGETKNFVVLSTVCLIFGIYFIGLAFARRADRKDKLKVVANVHLNHSDKSMGYRYDISIQTGMWKSFGTTANVGLIIVGKDGSSSVLSLNDLSISRRFFSRASVNNFTLSVPNSLGNLTGIYVWHDNSGAHPAWYLQHVIITDAQTQEAWYFFANQWLALDKGAGFTQLYLKVAEGNDLKAFKPRFISRATRSLGEGHLWISVFTRPPHNPFTRCQRLSCCLSFLFTSMVTNAMFYQFDKTPTDTFKFGPLTMSWTQIKIGIQSSVISIPINLLVVLIFRNIKQVQSSDVNVVDTDTTKTSGRLPRFFLYVAWAICVLVSLTGAFFTLLYSMQWGTDKSNQWLTSILVSLVQDVLVTQPIKVVAFATLLSFIIRKPPEIDPVMGPSFFRDKLGNKTKYPSAKDKDLKTKKEQSIRRRKMLEAAKEILTFLIFAFLLMVICYGNENPAAYHITKNIKDDISSGFDDIADPSSLWKWLEDDLIPALYDVTWYNGWQFKYKEGYISNRDDFMLGMPRLRQLRLKPAKRCPNDLLYPYFTEAFNRCLPTYSSSNEDRTAFNLPGWIPLKSYNKSYNYNDICPKPWRYEAKENIQSVSHSGTVNNYDGGGYVASLGYNKETALHVVRDLKGNNWIDELTAVVFIEFTVFNPATSLFTMARHAYERMPTGEALTKSGVRTLSLYPSTNVNFQSFYEVCQLVFLIVIVVCFIAEIVKFIRQKRYFSQLWNWIELLFLVVCVVAVATSFLKSKNTSLYVKKVQENPYETFSPDYVEIWSQQEITWLSAAIFILTLKLLRLIRFNAHICQMQGTMKRSARPLISFVFVFGIGMMAFTYFGCIAFGAYTSLFNSLYKSFETNMLLSIGKQINYVDIYLISSNLELIYFFFYFLLVICFLINVFIAVIVDSYAEIREARGEAFDDAITGAFMSANFSKAVQQVPGKLVLGAKQVLNFRCPDLVMSNKAFKRDRKRKYEPCSTNAISTLPQDVDKNNGTAPKCQKVIPLERNEAFSKMFQEAEMRDVIDDYYMDEIRKQLIGAFTELSKYHALTARNSREATVLDQE